MSKPEDVVILDGTSNASHWPLELAESLLKDPTPWGKFWPGHPENGPTRQKDFYTLANCVNVYRDSHWDGWENPLDNEQFSEHCSTYTTQALLDAIHLISQGDRFAYGLIRDYEPQMRQALQEVVRRMHSATPPIFFTALDRPVEEAKADKETKET